MSPIINSVHHEHTRANSGDENGRPNFALASSQAPKTPAAKYGAADSITPFVIAAKPATGLIDLPDELAALIFTQLERGEPLDVLTNRKALRSVSRRFRRDMPLSGEDQRRLRFAAFSDRDPKFFDHLYLIASYDDPKPFANAAKYLTPAQIKTFFNSAFTQGPFSVIRPEPGAEGALAQEIGVDVDTLDYVCALSLRNYVELYDRADKADRARILDQTEKLGGHLDLVLAKLSAKLNRATLEAATPAHAEAEARAKALARAEAPSNADARLQIQDQMTASAEQTRILKLFASPRLRYFELNALAGESPAIMDLIPQARIEAALNEARQAGPDRLEVRSFVTATLDRLPPERVADDLTAILSAARPDSVLRILTAVLPIWEKLGTTAGQAGAAHSPVQKVVLERVERFIAGECTGLLMLADLTKFMPYLEPPARTRLGARILAIAEPRIFGIFKHAALGMFAHKHLMGRKFTSRLVRKCLGPVQGPPGFTDPSNLVALLPDLPASDVKHIVDVIAERAAISGANFDYQALAAIPQQFPLRSSAAQNKVIDAMIGIQNQRMTYRTMRGLADGFAHLQSEQREAVIALLERDADPTQNQHHQSLARRMMPGVFPYLSETAQSTWLQRFYAAAAAINDRDCTIAELKPIAKYFNAQQHTEYVRRAETVKSSEHWLALFETMP